MPEKTELVKSAPSGSDKRREKKLAKFAADTNEQQLTELRKTWKETAYMIALRAKGFANQCSPQEFGRLYQLIMSGAVSIDKAFPPKEQGHNAPAFVVNMFGSLGQRASAIAAPPVPTITVEPIKETVEWQDSAGKTMSLSLTNTEALSTTTPSEASSSKPSAA